MKLALTADWHVDQYGSRMDPETGLNRRLLDYLRTARWVGEEASRRGAELMLNLGDFSERKHINGWLIARIQEALAAGPERLIAVRGNHDGKIGGRSVLDIIDAHPGWEGIDRPRVVRIGDLAICGVGYMDRHFARTQPGLEAIPEGELMVILAEQYLAIARGLYAAAMESGAKRAIFIGHQSVSGGHMSEAQEAFLGGVSLVVDSHALASIGYSLVALGHFHLAQTVLDGPDCPVVYPGSIERVDFGEADQQKSFLMVDMPEDPAQPVAIEVVPTPARRFVTLREVTSDIQLAEADVDGAVVRVLDADPLLDVAHLREVLYNLGAFDVGEIRVRRDELAVISGGMAESLAPTQALVDYFHDDDDADALVDRGRGVLAEVAA
jgi:exonuclease SbcD